MDPKSHAEVVIVGSGPVGLLLACELGEHGVRTLVLDERDGPSVHPRANTHSARSMELYRRLGLSSALRAGGLPQDRPTDVAYFTQLTTHELGRVTLPSPREALDEVHVGDTRWPTPEPQLRASQRVLEPLLLEQARSYPDVEIRLGWRMVSAGQDADGAWVEAHPASGEMPSRRFGCGYVVGCDGGRSLVRRDAGIRYGGEGGVELDFMGGRMIATYFRAPDLLGLIGAPPAWQYWALNPELRALLVAIDGRQDFVLHVQLRPDMAVEDFDLRSTLRKIVGLDVSCEVLSAAPWRAGQALVADRFSNGRLFIAGDAAHLFTPTGGFGLNTGIEDAANLAWKLAGACKGWAGPGMLDTYNHERRQIALRNTGVALSLARAVGACPVAAYIDENSFAGAEAREAAGRHIAAFARNEFDTPGVQLGARYDGSAAIAAEPGAVAPPDLPGTYIPSDVPGGRAPHVWLSSDTSLLDRLGHCFTLLCIDGAEGSGGLVACAAARGIPLAVVTIANDEACKMYSRRFTLVRPDQYIAWRGDTITSPGSLFDQVLLTAHAPRPLVTISKLERVQ